MQEKQSEDMLFFVKASTDKKKDEVERVIIEKKRKKKKIETEINSGNQGDKTSARDNDTQNHKRQ